MAAAHVVNSALVPAMVHVVNGVPSISVSMRRNQVAMTLACLALAGLVPEAAEENGGTDDTGATGGTTAVGDASGSGDGTEASAKRKRAELADNSSDGAGADTVVDASASAADVDMGSAADPSAVATSSGNPAVSAKRPRVGGGESDA